MGLQEFRTLYLEATLVKKCYRQLKPRGGLSLRGRQIQCWQLDFQELASGHGSSIPPLLGGVRASHKSGHRASLTGLSHLPGTQNPYPPHGCDLQGAELPRKCHPQKGWLDAKLFTYSF